MTFFALVELVFLALSLYLLGVITGRRCGATHRMETAAAALNTGVAALYVTTWICGTRSGWAGALTAMVLHSVGGIMLCVGAAGTRAQRGDAVGEGGR